MLAAGVAAAQRPQQRGEFIGGLHQSRVGYQGIEGLLVQLRIITTSTCDRQPLPGRRAAVIQDRRCS
jgi:hypothetical protein